MLALIALANSMIYLYDRPYGLRQHIVEPGMLDRVTSVLNVTFVDVRAYPMFAALFAYGMVQMMRRHQATGVPATDTRRVLLRRSRWLIVFGPSQRAGTRSPRARRPRQHQPGDRGRALHQ